MEQKVQLYYDKLSETLDEMTKIYRQLLELVRKEKDILIQVNLPEIESLTAQKEEMIQKLKIAEMLREKYAQNLGVELGLNSTAPRLSELAQKLPGVAADRLRQVQSALELVIARIQDLNRENENYVQSALKTLNGALGNIKETLSGKATYERKGQYKTGPDTAGHFVRREA
ncbi:MAG: flagellar protein FlgN [Bdellovibrionales bacterium]